MRWLVFKLISYSLELLMVVIAVGCGQGTVISSNAFQNAFAINRFAVEIQEFKFCVARVRLETQNDRGNDDANNLEFAPGLINLTSGEAIDWGTVTIPETLLVERIKVKVKKDTPACGTDYSVFFNGLSTPPDIEFRWVFDPPLPVNATTQALRLSFSEIVTALKASAMTSELELKSRIESVEGEAEVE